MDVVDRLAAAITAGDLDAMVACFAADYRNETPAHPSRGFTGSQQVRRNWTQIFAAVPELRATIVRRAQDAGTQWVEWDWSGSQPDRSPFSMRGVTVLGVEDDRIQWTRFYLEPVDSEAIDVATAVDRAIRSEP